MIPLYWFHPSKMFPTFVGAIMFFLTSFCGLVIYDTVFFPVENTITMGPVKSITAWNGSHGLVVEYARGFTTHLSRDGDVQRIVRCPPDEADNQVVLEGDTERRTFEARTYPAFKRVVSFDRMVPVHSRCVLETWAVWRPSFAINGRRWMLDSIPFEVSDHAPAP